MDALNMLTLMYTSTEVTSAQNQGQTQVSGQAAQSGVEFALLLHQQLWLNSMPQCMQGDATGETTGLFNLDLSDLTVLAGEETEAGSLTVSDTLAGATGETGTALTLSDLLTALVAELEQILGVLEATTASSSQTSTDGLATETTEAATLTDQFSNLISTWSQLIEKLNTWLADETSGLYTLSATNLTAQSARPAVTLLPWSSVAVTENTTAGSTVPDAAVKTAADQTGTPTVDAGTLALADESGAQLPQSIRWFQTAGILGSRTNQAAAVTAEPRVVTSEVALGNGETAQLTLAEKPGRLPGEVQAYSLRLDVPGAETSLTATLTVMRMDVLPTAETAQTVTQVMPGVKYQPPTVQAFTGGVTLPEAGTDGTAVQLLDPTGSLIQDATVRAANDSQVLPTTFINPELTVQPAVSGGAVNPVSVITPEVAITGAIPVPEIPVDGQTIVTGTPEVVATAETGLDDARMIAVDSTRLISDPVQVSSDVAGAFPSVSDASIRLAVKSTQPADTVAETVKTVPVTEAVVDTAVVDEQAVEASAWSTDYALENLGLSTETLEALESVMSRTTDPFSVERSETANTMTSVTQLADVLNPGQLTMNTTDSLPLQLLQYSQASSTIQSYTGLEYLEMAERIMDQVNAVRQGSGGFYQARLALNPPNLGEMFVNISVRGDAVALQLCVVSTVPKEQLKDSLESLRESLEEAGLYVTDIRVEEIPEQGGDADGDTGSDHGSDTGEGDTSRARMTSPVAAQVATSAGSQRMVPAIGFN